MFLFLALIIQSLILALNVGLGINSLLAGNRPVTTTVNFAVAAFILPPAIFTAVLAALGNN